MKSHTGSTQVGIAQKQIWFKGEDSAFFVFQKWEGDFLNHIL